jgi:nicotinate-nucleotide pyrophosphorylase (carboxylating)
MKHSVKEWQAIVREAAARAVGEDVGPDDVTSRAFIGEEALATGALVAREDCVLAGMDVAEAVFREVDGRLVWETLIQDGQKVGPNQTVAKVRGSARSVLTGERCALNFLQRLSGVASLSAEYAQAIAGTRTKILDTRKTTPGLRALERQAVRLGGGVNHRAGLYDGYLVKENHLSLVDPERLPELIQQARASHPDLALVVEADSLELAMKLLLLPVDRILVDNLTADQLREIVNVKRSRSLGIEIEASGGVTLERAQALSQAGVDFISVGKLTHSARSIDFSLDLIPG